MTAERLQPRDFGNLTVPELEHYANGQCLCWAAWSGGHRTRYTCTAHLAARELRRREREQARKGAES